MIFGRMKAWFVLLGGTLTLSLNSCDFLLGTRDNETVNEIFDQGAIDPNAVQSVVGYVPVLPVWSDFQSPTDVWVGYDEMVYVTDAQGLHILDQKGERFRTLPIGCHQSHPRYSIAYLCFGPNRYPHGQRRYGGAAQSGRRLRSEQQRWIQPGLARYLGSPICGP